LLPNPNLEIDCIKLVGIGTDMQWNCYGKMQGIFQEMVSTERYKGWEVKDIESSQPPELQLKVKKYSDTKRMLVEALFNKQRETPIDFAMSFAIFEDDEGINQAMKSRGHYAILSKRKFQFDHEEITYATHRLKWRKNLICLLENLTGKNQIKSKIVNLLPILSNKLGKNRGYQI
jgi:hypothetical protein